MNRYSPGREATDYIYNYLETDNGAVWATVCIGYTGTDGAAGTMSGFRVRT
jgi:hypothetical protein